MPLPTAAATAALRRGLRLSADRLDHPERGLPLQPDGPYRVSSRSSSHRSAGCRRTGAFRRCWWRSRSARSSKGRPVSARRWRSARPCSSVSGFTPLYAAGLSLIANTAPVAFGAIGTPILTLACRDRHSGAYARRHGRAAAAIRIADRARMAGGDDERLARVARRVARRARLRRHVRNRAVRLEQLRRRRARGHRRRAGVDRCARVVRAGLAAARGVGISGGRFVRRAPRCCERRRPSPRSQRRASRSGLATCCARGCRGCFSASR